MSLFIDVIEVLTHKIKGVLVEVIDHERKDQEKAVRKVCDACSKYLDYGELRYDKMEDGISLLQKHAASGNPLHKLLLAVLHESLDEDEVAIKYFMEFSDSSLAEPFRAELIDFIHIGRLITLKEYDKLERTGIDIIEKYTGEDNVVETLSNLYLKTENEEYNHVFQKLVARAREFYPSVLALESLKGHINFRGKEYLQALESFLTIKDRLEQDRENSLYDFSLASVWDNIAECYLNLNDAAKTIESCDFALSHDMNSKVYKVGNPILYKKAEALILLGEKDKAADIAGQILSEDPGDEQAAEIRNRITGSDNEETDQE
jgi:tetratricopeptide (TPR) repeat protein